MNHSIIFKSRIFPTAIKTDSTELQNGHHPRKPNPKRKQINQTHNQPKINNKIDTQTQTHQRAHAHANCDCMRPLHARFDWLWNVELCPAPWPPSGGGGNFPAPPPAPRRALVASVRQSRLERWARNTRRPRAFVLSRFNTIPHSELASKPPFGYGAVY